MVTTPTKPITLEQFLALPETKPASEYIAGEIIQKPMPQGKHSLLQVKLIIALNSLLMESSIAIAFFELRCTFGGRSTVPDVAVFKTEHIPKDDRGEIANTFNTAPDWVIEILSPEQSTTKVIKNILHCLNHGTEVGWLIDPAEKLIFIYHSGKQVEVIEDLEQTLIVPSFAAAVKLTAGEIFNWLKVE
jgi:Uma2 family endonuclease